MSTPPTIRTCVGCRTKAPALTLVRFTLDDEGEVRVDPTRQHSGRGAWLCPRTTCLEKAIHRKAFSRSFRCAVRTRDTGRLGREMDQTLSDAVERAARATLRAQRLHTSQSARMKADTTPFWTITDEEDWSPKTAGAVSRYRAWRQGRA